MAVATVLAATSLAQENVSDPDLQRWLGPQDWKRDTDGPIISLGPQGSFDDTHIFAPCVAAHEFSYSLWYCGSSGIVEDRVFRLGLATSRDGRTFQRHGKNPVLAFDDNRHSILTPTLLTNNIGTPQYEDGKLRMWFSSTNFHDKSGLHTLHESTSRDGTSWSPPSPALLQGVYAPTVLRDRENYRMWYTDVSKSPWVIRHAESRDGKSWNVDPTPALVVDQAWEQDRLFYSTVRKVNNVLLMWYGSYWKGQGSQKTALGFAVSKDGRRWIKSPHNPVLRPDAQRLWESHYVTSQCVAQMPGGHWRIWYASRTKPPFVHKYFAIGTATWAGPGP